VSGVEHFCAGLVALGFVPEVEGDFVRFGYLVPIGVRRGEEVRLAFRVPPDWPANPPTGPFVSPRLLPINPTCERGRPWDSVHEAAGQGMPDPDGDWQYWSRPFPQVPGWAATDRSVRTYMAHIKTLFDELPDA
jgi:hypothetical protein